MLNKIWMASITAKARVKEALGLKLTSMDNFLLEIRLY